MQSSLIWVINWVNFPGTIGGEKIALRKKTQFFLFSFWEEKSHGSNGMYTYTLWYCFCMLTRALFELFIFTDIATTMRFFICVFFGGKLSFFWPAILETLIELFSTFRERGRERLEQFLGPYQMTALVLVVVQSGWLWRWRTMSENVIHANFFCQLDLCWH